MKYILCLFLGFFLNLKIAHASDVIKIEFDDKCKEKAVVNAFKSSNKVAFVKPDFDFMDEKELKISLTEGQSLSNDEIKEIAKTAKCEVVFVKRKA